MKCVEKCESHLTIPLQKSNKQKTNNILSLSGINLYGLCYFEHKKGLTVISWKKCHSLNVNIRQGMDCFVILCCGTAIYVWNWSANNAVPL